MATLVLGYHGPLLTGIGAQSGKGKCEMFPVFPGTPSFLTPGLPSYESIRNEKVSEFIAKNRGDLDLRRAVRKLVILRGTVKVKRDFRIGANGHGNGFGYHGAFRTAILVEDIALAE